MELKVITMESEAFYALMEEVIQRVGAQKPPRWIREQEAMELLGIKSKSHLWSLRTNLKIEYFQDEDHPKLIMYDRESIERYLKSNMKKSL